MNGNLEMGLNFLDQIDLDCVDRWMDGHMHVCMDEWMHAWTNGCMHGWIYACRHGWMGACVCACTHACVRWERYWGSAAATHPNPKTMSPKGWRIEYVIGIDEVFTSLRRPKTHSFDQMVWDPSTGSCRSCRQKTSQERFQTRLETSKSGTETRNGL